MMGEVLLSSRNENLIEGRSKESALTHLGTTFQDRDQPLQRPSAGQRRACLRNREGLCHWGEGLEGVGPEYIRPCSKEF